MVFKLKGKRVDIRSMVISISVIALYQLLKHFNLYDKIIYPVQFLIVRLIYYIQSFFGVNLTLDNFTLVYSTGLTVEITPLCVGIEQIIFFFFLLSLFVGIEFKSKLKYFLIFAPIIFLTNFLRLFFMYSLSSISSIETMWKIHNFLYLYGHAFFCFFLVVIWYFFLSHKKLKH